MMAKITKGHDFGGAVRYVTQEKKDAKQAQLRPDVKVMVGHISLDFSKEDVDKVDDNLMRKVADDYMRRMHIQNTQYILVRHYDREHPHCHLVFNRINNDGHLISDKNDRIRSAKICKELTQKYGLHMAQGKDDALVNAVPRCKNWKELEAALKKHDINMSIVYRGTTTDVQGVAFEKDGLHFNGSKVDRKFSFSKISAELRKNAQTENHRLKTGRSDYGNYEHESGQSIRQHSYINGNNTHQSHTPLGHDTSGDLGHIASDAASATLDVASAAASVVTDVAAGIVAGALSVMTAPTVSYGGSSGGGGGSSNEDLGDDYYIDEHGIRRKKRRGLRR